MNKYEFLLNTSADKFLNTNAINILQIIFNNPKIQCKTLIYRIKKAISVSRSTCFRYFSTLYKNNLIRKDFRNRKGKNGYVFYELTSNGNKFLLLFKEFLVKKVLLNGLQKGITLSNSYKKIFPDINFIESKMRYRFKHQVFFGDELTIRCEIILKDELEPRVDFIANCLNNNGKRILKTMIFDIPFLDESLNNYTK